MKYILLLSYSLLFIFLTSCCSEDKGIDYSGKWSRPSCDGTEPSVSYEFIEEEVYPEGYRGTDHIFLCGLYPHNPSVFEFNEETNSIYFKPKPIEGGTFHNKVGEYQWLIDSSSSDYIRYNALDIGNDITHKKLLELWKE